jgi:hypothetical protein
MGEMPENGNDFHHSPLVRRDQNGDAELLNCVNIRITRPIFGI